jgi:hypothetical protein
VVGVVPAGFRNSVIEREREREARTAYRILVGKPGGKRPLGRQAEMEEGRILWFGWFHLAQDRVQLHAVVNMVMNLQVP